MIINANGKASNNDELNANEDDRCGRFRRTYSITSFSTPSCTRRAVETN